MPRSGSRRNPASFRSQRRSDAHDAAHAGNAPAARDLPDHPLIPAGDPEMIDSAAGLASLIDELRSSAGFAYDTEFIGEESYHPRICLVQIATADRIVLIDPITGGGLDLTPLWELIADPEIETIVHAGQQDLEPVVRAGGLGRDVGGPANIFDTQVAAGFIALPYPLGLTKLTQTLLDLELHKDFTFARWDRRPLSLRLQRYAADDVRFLPALREAIGKRLRELGHEAHACDECRAFEQIEQYRFDADTVLPRVNGSRALDSRGLAVLRELVILRDNAARQLNLPPRSVLRDDVLVRLVKEGPKSVAKLENIRGLPRPFQREFGTQTIEAIERGRACPKHQRPPRLHEEETPEQRFAIDGLTAAASVMCHGMSIDPSLAFTRGEIASWYRAHMTDDAPAADGRLERGWRKELIADRLRAMLDGDDQLKLRWTSQGLIADGGGDRTPRAVDR